MPEQAFAFPRRLFEAAHLDDDGAVRRDLDADDVVVHLVDHHQPNREQGGQHNAS